MITASEHKKGLDALKEALIQSGKEVRAPVWLFGSSVNSLSFVRSLGRRGIRCIVIDDEALIGAQSRYSTFVQVGLSELETEEGRSVLIEAVQQCITHPVLFATSDGHNGFLARFENELSTCCQMITPSAQIMDIVLDKAKQYEEAEKAGVPIPRCIYPHDEMPLQQIEEEVGYPCIIKPRVSHVGRRLLGGRKVRVIEGPEDLQQEWKNLGSACNQFMIQEIIPGSDQLLYGYLAFWSGESKELAWLTKQKLRQNPPIYGDGSWQRSVDCPEVRELSSKLLETLNYTGFVSVEFKLDERSGSFKLMEINPRTVSGNQLAISSGIDLPWIGYLYLTDPDSLVSAEFVPNVYFVNEEWDLRAYMVMRRSGELSVWAFLRSLLTARARAIWAWDDLRPAWTTFKAIIKAFQDKYRRSAKVEGVK